MVLKVDLGCERCCKKIRKLICKIPGESLIYVFGVVEF